MKAMLNELTDLLVPIFKTALRIGIQLDVYFRSSQTISELKRKLIQLVRPKRQSYFGVHDIEGIRYLTQLRVKFSDLREQGLDITFIA